MRNRIGKRMTVALLAAGAVALGGAGTALATSDETPTNPQDEKRGSVTQPDGSAPPSTSPSDAIAVEKLPNGGVAIKKVDPDEVEPGTGSKPAKPMKYQDTKPLERGDDIDAVPAKSAEPTEKQQ
ncbi:hypothetical protein [Prauserella rugosa]|uniref:Uncharacterized protein n=1 Tax=Prauserella rugosa TaxID=43354 RepID=A0A660CKG6_9PSEU|nr:hypothetical protein [Prauserella rugosa]KID29309.1 hypothetical protein HQ32_03601 [Prauserella sp. Am3]TWH21525.1 hypothetical protein JD82_03389 [Prauserella rugosa]